MGRLQRQCQVRGGGQQTVPGQWRGWDRSEDAGQPPQQRGGARGGQEDHEDPVQVPRRERQLRHPDLLETTLRLQVRNERRNLLPQS